MRIVAKLRKIHLNLKQMILLVFFVQPINRRAERNIAFYFQPSIFRLDKEVQIKLWMIWLSPSCAGRGSLQNQQPIVWISSFIFQSCGLKKTFCQIHSAARRSCVATCLTVGRLATYYLLVDCRAHLSCYHLLHFCVICQFSHDGNIIWNSNLNLTPKWRAIYLWNLTEPSWKSGFRCRWRRNHPAPLFDSVSHQSINITFPFF